MRKVLVAAIGTLLVLCILLPAISALLRPLDLLDITAIVLSLFAAIAWLIVAGVLATAWKWRSALLAVAVALVLAITTNWHGVLSQSFVAGAQRWNLRFRARLMMLWSRRTPKSNVPRLIRVSHRDVSGMCCGEPLFEEIWFDEGDAFASPDFQVRDRHFQSTHPWQPDETRRSAYWIRPLGGHYYFIDARH